jgi:hypothetical protein
MLILTVVTAVAVFLEALFAVPDPLPVACAAGNLKVVLFRPL